MSPCTRPITVLVLEICNYKDKVKQINVYVMLIKNNQLPSKEHDHSKGK